MPLPNLSAPIAFLPGLLMEGVVRVRNSLYDHGVLPVRSLPRPVISVGNLTVGGTGKTPAVIYIARLLRAAGLNPVLLSRGYGRRSAGSTLLVGPGNEGPCDPATLGDEPALVRRHVPGIWLALDPDRFRAASAALARGAGDVFLMDDGFQHRALHRALDVVMVDCTRPFATDHTIPRGTLREPRSSLRRADIVLLNGGSPEIADRLETEIRRLAPRAGLFRISQRIETVVEWERWRTLSAEHPDEPRFRQVFLVAAIGNPSRFVRDVEESGRVVRGTRFFRDHASPDAETWENCARHALRSGADSILTTEKDAVKLTRAPSMPLGVCIQSTAVQPAAEFEAWIIRAAGVSR